jgi:hypothetical protein
MRNMAQFKLHSNVSNAHVKFLAFILKRAVNLHLPIKRTCFEVEIGLRNLYFSPSSYNVAEF